MTAAIKFFDCFAGIGGFRSGLEKAGGYECIGFCEIDKNAETAYRAMYDTEKEVFYNDITKINAEEMPDFDLFVGGFPCQPFSVAGKRRGFEDTRGTLFYHIARVIKHKRPAAFLLENVPGLLSHGEGQTYLTILRTLSELGYCIEWFVHNSAGFGVPQSRKRVYIVGYLRAECAGKIFPVECLAPKNPKRLIDGPQGSRVYSTDGTAVTQCAGSGGGGGKTGLYIDLNADPELTELARCILARYDAGVSNHRGSASGVLVEEQPCAVLCPEKENPRQNGRRMKNPNEPMFTITVTDRHGVVHKGRVRKLMPIECWRLQGFSDKQFRAASSVIKSDGHLYKMAGNAVTVNVIEAIGRKIKAVLFDGGVE